MSINGAVNFRLARHSYSGLRIQHTKVLKMCSTTAGCDTYSKAVGSSLTLQGTTVMTILRWSSGDTPAYVLCINDMVYMPNTDRRATCEFSIETPLPSHTHRENERTGEKTLHDDAYNCPSQHTEEPVVLMSLYSIQNRRCLYQNFLILAKSHRDPDAYKRIGIGSGKLYRNIDQLVNSSSETGPAMLSNGYQLTSRKKFCVTIRCVLWNRLCASSRLSVCCVE